MHDIRVRVPGNSKAKFGVTARPELWRTEEQFHLLITHLNDNLDSQTVITCKTLISHGFVQSIIQNNLRKFSIPANNSEVRYTLGITKISGLTYHEFLYKLTRGFGKKFFSIKKNSQKEWETRQSSGGRRREPSSETPCHFCNENVFSGSLPPIISKNPYVPSELSMPGNVYI